MISVWCLINGPAIAAILDSYSFSTYKLLLFPFCDRVPLVEESLVLLGYCLFTGIVFGLCYCAFEAKYAFLS